MSKNNRQNNSQKAALYIKDTALLAFTYHYTKPSIYNSNTLQNVFAFITKISICKQPPRSLKKNYFAIKWGQNEN